MIRIMPLLVTALAACTSTPQESAMPSSGRNAGSSLEGAGMPESGNNASRNASAQAGVMEKQDGAARGPVPEPVSAAENPLRAVTPDSSAEARGRRTLSTAFVMVGADGRLTVELRDGRVLVLRDVTMRRKDYCGVQVLKDGAGTRYCGKYAAVMAARPGGMPGLEAPDLAPSNRLEAPAIGAKNE